MQVIFHNRSQTEADLPARQVPLATAMAADFVVIAVPGGAETRHMINAEVLAQMSPHGILINIARGDVIDESALAAHLVAGRIAGAGLDVYEREPEITPALLSLQNVTLLPHLGTAVEAVRTDMGLMALANLIAFQEGRPLPNPV
jgi:lactate dehydrogenase-like 2-hydroxyacid dehydrogenase